MLFDREIGGFVPHQWSIDTPLMPNRRTRLPCTDPKPSTRKITRDTKLIWSNQRLKNVKEALDFARIFLFSRVSRKKKRIDDDQPNPNADGNIGDVKGRPMMIGRGREQRYL